jgi:predicted Zn-dependent protease
MDRGSTTVLGSAGRAYALASVALFVALALALGSCASIDTLAPPHVAAAAPPPAAPTAVSPPVSPERKRLVEAFGGEYSAPAVERYLDAILARLAPVSETASEPYRVTLLDSPIVNAFALP